MTTKDLIKAIRRLIYGHPLSLEEAAELKAMIDQNTRRPN